jgi:putative ABC transport system permease protein
VAEARPSGGPGWRDEIRRRLSALNLSERRVNEIADEIAEHLEDRHAQMIADGHSADDARAAVWRELEAPDALARRVHYAEHPGLTDVSVTRSQGQRVMRRIANDMRMGLRSLRKIRGATALAIVAFALGIGITTAVFSVFYGVLLKPLPYPDADRMVQVFDTQPSCKTCPAGYTKYMDWRTRNSVFEEIAGVWNRVGVVTGLGDADRISIQNATWSVPAVFKVQPMLGRWFTAAEDAPGGDHVVVLGNQYWKDRFGARPSALGQGLVIDGVGYRIVGVMPPNYQITAQLFRPLQLKSDPSTRGNHYMSVYARLKPGVSVAQAQKEMVALGGALAKEFGHNHGIDVQSYPERVLGQIRQPLRVLMGAVSLVLVIACANIANLLLAAGTSRRREFALRAAIGATKWDLARQMIVESVALAFAGGILGLGVAALGVQAFVVLGDQIVPRAATVSVDGTVVLFALGLSLATGVFCALWPVIRLDPARLAMAVREGDTRGGTDAASRRFGSGLVIAEIAIAFSLLVGSGLLVKDLLTLESRSLGFETERLIAFDLPLAGDKYSNADAVRAFYDDLLPKLAAVPRVERVAATRNLPVYNVGWNSEMQVEGGNPWPAGGAPLIEQAPVTPDYFAVFGMPIRAGRAFDQRDRQGAEPVTIITKGTAEKFWPGQNPIGKHIAYGGGPVGPNNPWIAVVGIVDDSRSFGYQGKVPYQMYFPAAQSPSAAMSIVLRVAAEDPAVVMADVRAVVKSVNPSLPVSKVQTLNSVVSKSVSQPRLISTLTAVFGAMAGIMAAVGVYGVMAYNVRRDRRQYGIQLALGAQPSQVRRAIVSRGLTLGSLGIAIGGVGAYWLTNFLKSLLTDVKPTDPWIFAGTALSLLVVSVAACAWPAFQAGRTDPMVALRAD